jgi:hypothetical protein
MAESIQTTLEETITLEYVAGLRRVPFRWEGREFEIKQFTLRQISEMRTLLARYGRQVRLNDELEPGADGWQDRIELQRPVHEFLAVHLEACRVRGEPVTVDTVLDGFNTEVQLNELVNFLSTLEVDPNALGAKASESSTSIGEPLLPNSDSSPV